MEKLRIRTVGFSNFSEEGWEAAAAAAAAEAAAAETARYALVCEKVR
jgi:hypothetical protein